jgi:uncharacterized protein YkwD
MRRGIAVLTASVALNSFGATDCALGDLQRETLLRVNAARTAGGRCGNRAMPPVPAVGWDVSLYAAAHSHSQDMAQRNYFDHRSPEGKGVRQRATAHRYPARTLGENIAGGDTAVAGVMETWLTSPDHCNNIMDPEFTDMAVACVRQAGTQLGTYWTMVLGRKR